MTRNQQEDSTFSCVHWLFQHERHRDQGCGPGRNPSHVPEWGISTYKTLYLLKKHKSAWRDLWFFFVIIIYFFFSGEASLLSFHSVYFLPLDLMKKTCSALFIDPWQHFSLLFHGPFLLWPSQLLLVLILRLPHSATDTSSFTCISCR